MTGKSPDDLGPCFSWSKELCRQEGRWIVCCLVGIALSSAFLFLPRGVVAQDNSALPPQPQAPSSNGTVAVAIERIRHSRYAPMPEPKCASGGNGVSLLVENRTTFVIRYLLQGPTSQELTVEPSLAIKLNLSAGRYRVAAEIPNSSVMPFYAERAFDANTQCQQVFYMSEGSAAAIRNPAPAAGETRDAAPATRPNATESVPTTGDPSVPYIPGLHFHPGTLSLPVFDEGVLYLKPQQISWKESGKYAKSHDFTVGCQQVKWSTPLIDTTAQYVYIDTFTPKKKRYSLRFPTRDAASVMEALKGACLPSQ